MKLCVTSTGENLESKADGSFGRAHYFLVIDTDSLQFEVIPNASASATQGAGIAAAQTISDKGVDALLTGYVGPKALMALENTGIKIYEGININETVQEAVQKFNQGSYKVKSDSIQDTTCRQGTGGGQRCGGGRGRGQGRGQRGAL